MNPVILFRKEYSTEEELQIARQFFPVVELRSQVPANSLVIGRYSTLPYYRELEMDLQSNNSELINSHKQHQWIADFQWYNDLEEFTPQTWYRLQDLPDDGTQFIVKGKTNSRKFDWDTLMYAKDKAEAIRIFIELSKDPVIAPQGIIFRRYIPLVTFEKDFKGLPYSNEWRFFFYRDNLLTYSYYWTAAQNVTHELAGEGLKFAMQVAGVVKDHCNFFVIDIAEKAAGGWTLIEINDAQSSGLSENQPDILYSQLTKVLGGNPPTNSKMLS